MDVSACTAWSHVGIVPPLLSHTRNWNVGRWLASVTSSTIGLAAEAATRPENKPAGRKATVEPTCTRLLRVGTSKPTTFAAFRAQRDAEKPVPASKAPP